MSNTTATHNRRVSYDIATLAQDVGFTWHCSYFYVKPRCKLFAVDEHYRHYTIKNVRHKLYETGTHFVLSKTNALYAPTQTALQKWLRDVYNIECYAYPYKDHAADVNDANVYRGHRCGTQIFMTFEDALEADLYKGLTILKTQLNSDADIHSQQANA